MSDKPLIVFLLATAVLIGGIGFAAGVVFHAYQPWPYDDIRNVYHHIRTLVRYGSWAPDGVFLKAPKSASRQRVEVFRPDLTPPGYLAIMGYEDATGDYVVWLLDERGTELHRWPVDYYVLDADGPLNERTQPHGLAVLRDGSIIVNFDFGDVIGRLDACGRPIWRKSGVYHHSLSGTDDGYIWTWRGEAGANSHHQYLVKLDPKTGETVTELSLVDDFLKASPEAMVVARLWSGFRFQNFQRVAPKSQDIFHPNDVEALPGRLADRFPGFAPGDLLISLRQPDLVAVLDAESRTIKWWSHGPWSQQHDPDFETDGRIWVYDNAPDLSRSRLIGIDPRTRDIELAYSRPGIQFRSQAMGKHQALPNGTRLIVIPGQGRVLITTREGEKVLAFNNVRDDRVNLHVGNAIWLPPDYFDTVPACAAEGG